MAPVLVCPECQTKHPLDSIGPRSAFPCTGCGRTLKVPGAAMDAALGAVAVDRPPVSTPPVSSAPEPELGVTNAVPTAPPAIDTAPPIAPPVSVATAAAATGPPLGMPNSTARTARPAPVSDLVPNRFIRFALWIVAVPLAFMIVFTLARTFGLLSTNDVTDVALAEGWHRFMPIVRLLPFVALATAGLVQGGVWGITRLRESRRGGRTPDAGAKPAAGPKPAPAWKSRQSSGKGA